jgi:hypothetical protein
MAGSFSVSSALRFWCTRIAVRVLAARMRRALRRTKL